MSRWCVMSGGGKYGALQVGMLHELIVEQHCEYDGFAGVSVGAINAAFMSQARPQDTLVNQLEKLRSFWLGIRGNKSIYKNWFPLRQLAGVLYRDAIYDSTPLHETLKANISDEVARTGRKLRLGVTGFSSGKYKVVTEQESDLWSWVAASAAFPGVLLPIRRNDDAWLDGGGLEVTPITAAIKAGAGSIDVLLASSLEIPVKDPKDNTWGTKFTGLKVALRGLEMMGHAVFLKDIKQALMYNELVALGSPRAKGKRVVHINVYAPKVKEGDMGFSLDFEPITQFVMMLELGRGIVKRGPVAV